MRWRGYAAGLLGATTLLGCAIVWQFRSSPFYTLPILDEQSYWEWAKAIASGDVLGKKTYYQDPLYPYLLSGYITVFGERVAGVRFVQVLMGTASVGLVLFAGRKLLGPAWGFAAGILLALYHGLYFFELQIEKSSLAILLSAASCALFVVAVERGARPLPWWALGLVLGLLTLLRGNLQPVLPFLLVWALFPWRPRASALARSGALALGIATAVLPVTIRNRVVSGEWVLTTSQGGANFYIGNSEHATGRYVTLPFVRANPLWEAEDFEREAERRTGHRLSPSQVSRFWLGEGLAWMRQNPGRAARLLLHKAHIVVHDHEIPDNHSHYVTRDLFAPALFVPLLGFGLLWGPAALGALSLSRADRRAQGPALFMVLYGLSLVPFFVVDRYRMPLAPPLALFAAAGLRRILDAHRAADTRAVRLAAAFLAASWIVGFVPTAESRTPVGVEYFLIGNAYLKKAEPAAALPYLEKALAALPDRKDVQLSRAEALRQVNEGSVDWLLARVRDPGTSAEELPKLGRSLEKLGQVAAAAAAYEAAVAKDPAEAEVHGRLGYLYATSPLVRDPRRAETHLMQALDLRPDDADTMNALGNVAFLQGDKDKARSWWERTLRKQPDNAGARQNLARIAATP